MAGLAALGFATAPSQCAMLLSPASAGAWVQRQAGLDARHLWPGREWVRAISALAYLAEFAAPGAAAS